MKQRIFQIDAFTDKVFGGNPAAVCVLEKWIDNGLMQQIASENNLAETAFVCENEGQFEIRWFTPTVEVALCGHATLASAHVLYEYYNFNKEKIDFQSAHSGILRVEKTKDKLTLDFPVDVHRQIELPANASMIFGLMPQEAYKGKTDLLFVFQAESNIRNMEPNISLLSQLDARGVIVSAPGKEVDFVSRFFAPQSGIDEDPVTGSAHTTLTPYWSKRLGKTTMTAQQLSERRGDLLCEYFGERVKITGSAVTYMIGEIEI